MNCNASSPPRRDHEQHEAQRQAALLLAIHAGARELPEGWQARGRFSQQQGLQAYQRNAAAIALRALQQSYPVLAELVGDEGFAALAHGLWGAEPPEQGDLGTWGQGLADFIAHRPELAQEPYLSDVARLEWQVHRALRTQDDAGEVVGLQLLATSDPDCLRVRWRVSSVCLGSDYPVGSIWRAHQAQASAEQRALHLTQARQALLAGQGQTVVVFRRAWRSEVDIVPPELAALCGDLWAGHSLGQVLRQHDAALFEPWLLQALRQGWLSAVEQIQTS